MWGGWLGKVTRRLHCSQPPRVVLGACSHRNVLKFWCPEIISGMCTYTVKTKGLFQFGYRSSQLQLSMISLQIAMTYLDIEEVS